METVHAICPERKDSGRFRRKVSFRRKPEPPKAAWKAFRGRAVLRVGQQLYKSSSAGRYRADFFLSIYATYQA